MGISPRYISITGTHYARFQAELSASIWAAGQSQVLKDIFGGNVFHVTISPNCAHRSIQWSAWIRPDSVHKTCPLKNRAQNAVVRPAVYDSVMLQIIFLHLECYSNNTQIPNQRIVWAWAVHEESDVSEAQESRTFLFLPWDCCVIDISFCHLAFC